MTSPAFLLFLLLLLVASPGSCDGIDDEILHHDLSNGVSMPLVGVGIGNLPHDQIPAVVRNNLSAGIELVDTARASDNERILAKAVRSFDESTTHHTRGGSVDPGGVHVITKVWYTHLGYERTKYSVQQSLIELAASSSRQVYVHMLLHWPRCDDSVPWMQCELEENRLPQSVRDLGPAPHLDKANAFKESWRALEDVYDEHRERHSQDSVGVQPPRIVSIGVSNFDYDDMTALLDVARTKPHVYQGNSWLVFHDPYMQNLLKDHNILFQAYAVMNGIVQRREAAPNAFRVLTGIARELTASAYAQTRGQLPAISEGTVVLAYFANKHIGVVPRASSKSHQEENSVKSVKAVLHGLTYDQIRQLEFAIPSLMKGEDIHASVSFMNSLDIPIQIHWINPHNHEEVLVSEIIQPGAVQMHNTHPGHKFVAYDPDRTFRKELHVNAQYGDTQHFKISAEL